MKRAHAVTVSQNTDIDWTPAATKVHPRQVEVKDGNLIVEIEEIQYPDGTLAFLVGAGDGTAEKYNNIMSPEITPDGLDIFIALLIAARDKARALGMPSVKRPR